MEILLHTQNGLSFYLRFVELINQATDKSFRVVFDIPIRNAETGSRVGVKTDEAGRNSIIYFRSQEDVRYDLSKIPQLLQGLAGITDLVVPPVLEIPLEESGYDLEESSEEPEDFPTLLPTLTQTTPNPAWQTAASEYDFFNTMAEYVPLMGPNGLIALWVNEKIQSGIFTL